MSFKKENYRYLLQTNAFLVKELTETGTETSVDVQDARKGGLTMAVDGKYVHSKYDPQREAERFLSSEQRSLHIHFGFGLGYFLEADHTVEGGIFIIFEPDPQILKATLVNRDLVTLLREKNAVLCITAFHFKMLINNHLKAGTQARFFVSPFHKQAYPLQLKETLAILAEAKMRREFERHTLSEISHVFVEGALRALPYTTVCPGVDRLVGAFEGKPAVLVAAGPSLDRNLPLLAAHREKVIVFAISRAARSLERFGIEPDFLVHNEAQDFIHLIKGCTNLNRANFLLAEQAQVAYYKFPHRRTFVYQNPNNVVTQWLVQQSPGQKKTFLPTGGSVATEAFAIAFNCGCSPIILIGQDLALTGGRQFAASETNVGYDHLATDEIWQKGYFGGKVKTLRNYLHFIQWFQNSAAHFALLKPSVKFINATEGGAYLEGFEPMKLAHAIHAYAKEILDLDALIGRRDQLPPECVLSPPALQELLRPFDEKIQLLEQLNARFNVFVPKFSKFLEKGEIDKGRQLTKLLRQMDEFNQCFTDALNGFDVLSGMFQKQILDVDAKIRGRTARESQTMNDVAVQVQEDLALLKSLFEGMSSAVELIKPALGSVYAVLQTRLLAENQVTPA